jgi:hypothetical protein
MEEFLFGRGSHLNRTEVEKIITHLGEQVVEDIALGEVISNEEAEKAMAEAVAMINRINPKNQQSATIQTAPDQWSQALQCAATAIIYRARAALHSDARVHLSGRYKSMANFYQTMFDQLGPKLMQNRPASAGSRPRR